MLVFRNKKLFFCLFILIFFQNCEKVVNIDNKKAIEIDFSQVDPDNSSSDSLGINNHPIYLAISGMISPKETYKYYQELAQYISDKIKRQVKFKQRKSYQEVNKLIAAGEVDIAFISAGAYVFAEGNIPIEIIAVPEVHDKHSNQAYIIVHKDSPYQNFTELRSRSFAFTDPLSNTGYLYPLSRVISLGSTPERYFSKTVFTYANDYSMQAVARKIVDGASVNGLLFDYLKETYPKRVQNIKIIETSEPYGAPPIVVPKLLNAKLKNKLRSILLEIHQDPEGQTILKHLQIDRFIPPNNTNYSQIRKNLLMINR